MHLWQFTHFSLSTEITERYFPVCVFRFFVISNSFKSDLVNLIQPIYNENCFSSSIDVFYIFSIFYLFVRLLILLTLCGKSL